MADNMTPHLSDSELADVKKSLISEAQTLASSGALPPETSNQFIDLVYDESMAVKMGVRAERFDPATKEIDKMDGQKWVMFPKSEGQDPRVRAKVTTSQIVLEPKDFTVVWEMTDNFLRRNIMRGNANGFIMRMMAKAAANNMEMCLWGGDTLGPADTEQDYYGTENSTQYVKNASLAQFDGWLKRLRGANLYDAGGDPIGSDMLVDMMQKLPTKYQGGPLKFALPKNLEWKYNQRLSARATPVGDAALGGNSAPSWGIPRVPVPLLAMYPKQVEHKQLNGETDVDLFYAPIRSVVVTPITLAKTPLTPYVENTDYVVDYNLGKIHRVNGGAITDGQTVKITYESNPNIVLTEMSNLIVALGRDMKFAYEYRSVEDVHLFVMHMSLGCQIQELAKSVLAYNVGDTV